MRSVVFVASPRGVAALAASVVASLWWMPVDQVRAQDRAPDGTEQSAPLPPVDVISTRIGTRRSSGGGNRSPSNTSTSSESVATGSGAPVVGGITGASTTIITSDDLTRAPQATLQDVLSREAGIQTTSLYGGVNGTGTTVDMRGFGVTAPSNVLVLVDGRRFNDSDLTGFDFSLIPRNAIDRIEITRGNSGAVLYGDGAVGGVINIVTKNGVGATPNARVEGSFGTFRTREAKVSVSSSYNGLAAAAFGNAFHSDGYRANNHTDQNQGVGDLRYTTNDGTVYFFNISGDDLRQRLPGPRNITNGPFVGFFNEYVTDRRGTNTPLDYGNRQNLAIRGGVTRNLWNGAELTVDGSFRQKQTQFASFTPYNGFFGPNIPSVYNSTELTTGSVTPRLNVDQTFDMARFRMIAGIDVYRTNYESERSAFKGAMPNHVYNLEQTTTAGYAQPTLTLWQNTDLSIGGRVQRNSLRARDAFDPTAPVGPAGANPQGLPLDTTETQHATHLGVEHRFNPYFAVFGRMAQSFRVPNVDERVGASAIFTVTNFNLRTQRSHDYEGGFRINAGPFNMQTSAYRMVLTDELHFSPITFANTNLDPTLRRGVETALSYSVTDDFRLKGTVSHTRALFRSGPFAGNDIPEVARWTGAAGFSWDVYRKYFTIDTVARFVGKRFMDGDEANLGQMRVPSYGVVDVRFAGEVENLFWAVNVQNLFDRQYFDYGLDTSFTGNQFFSVYPLPGRVIQFKLGARFG
jgi:iron complex outermembrane receptor protein